LIQPKKKRISVLEAATKKKIFLEMKMKLKLYHQHSIKVSRIIQELQTNSL